MNKNKGFAPIAIVLIVIAIFAVGAIAHYVGKNSKTFTKTEENRNDASESTASSTICTPSSKPSLTIVSPKSGEKYYRNGVIDLQWTSCNLPASARITGKLVDVSNASSERALFCDGQFAPQCFQGNTGDVSVLISPSDTAGTYKIGIASSEDMSISSLSNSFTILANNAPDNAFHESGNDINGQHLGYVKDISLSNGVYYVKIDYVISTSCSDGIKCPNGYYLENQNTQLRTLPIASDAVIKMLEPGNPSSQILVTPAQLKDIISSRGQGLFWITLHKGAVTEVTEQYVP